MPDRWYPDGVRDEAPGSLWGTHVVGAAPKFLLHTTEGAPGAYNPDPRVGTARRYFGHTYWPTYTLAVDRRSGSPTHGRWRVFCHVPADRAARALANAAGGVETNRCNVSQVEIAWQASRVGLLPDEALDELARLLAWEHAARGVPLVSTVRWVGSEGYGRGASQRLPGSAWVSYAGVLGHQHAAENDHWDPGRFPVQALLSRAREIVGEGGDAVTEQDKADIARLVLEQLREQVFAVTPQIRQAGPGQTIGATYNKVGDVQAALAEVQRRQDFLYGQLAKFAPSAGVVLDAPPWRAGG